MKRWVSLLVTTALCLGCQPEPSPASLSGPRYLTVSGLPDGAASLELVLALDGKAGSQRPLVALDPDLVRTRTRITVDLGLEQVAGQLLVCVGAFDAEHRLIAAGHRELALAQEAPSVALSTDVPSLGRDKGGPLIASLAPIDDAASIGAGALRLPPEGGAALRLRGFGLLRDDRIEVCAGVAAAQRCVPAPLLEWRSPFEVAIQAPPLAGALGQPITLRVKATDGTSGERAGLLSYYERGLRLDALERRLVLPVGATATTGGQGLTIADFDGKDGPDIAVSTSALSGAAPTLQLFWNGGDGQFTTAPRVYAQPDSALPGTATWPLLSADWNGDGRPDLAQLEADPVRAGRQRLSLYFNDGKRPGDPFANIQAEAPFFHRPDVQLPLERGSWFAATDLNRDGAVDLLAYFEPAGQPPVAAGALRTFLNPRGQPGAFQAAGDGDCDLVGLVGHTAQELPLQDLNGDGMPDVVLDGSLYPATGMVSGTPLSDGPAAVQVALDDGGGRCGAVRRFPLRGQERTRLLVAAAGDADGDGNADVFALGRKVGALLLLGDGRGNFRGQLVLSTAEGLSAWLGGADLDPQAARFADLNGDGLPDLALALVSASGGTGRLLVLLNQGGGQLPEAASASGRIVAETGVYGSRLAIADLDRDGRSDVVVFNTVGRTLSVLLSRPEVRP